MFSRDLNTEDEGRSESPQPEEGRPVWSEDCCAQFKANHLLRHLHAAIKIMLFI